MPETPNQSGDRDSALHAIRPNYKLLVPITVRWGDMDAYGHVNNATFSTYFETARMKFFEKECGIHLGGSGI